jgi:uncharacterized protein YdaU (DUF1376 family)
MKRTSRRLHPSRSTGRPGRRKQITVSKAPAFQFYPGDFVSGSVGMMTPEEVGVYVLLLCLDWNQTGFAYEPTKLARWCRLTPKQFAKVWENVGPNFEDRDGRLFNPRLEEERANQASNRIKKTHAANVRWHPESNAPAYAPALQMECPSSSTTSSSSSSDVVIGSAPIEESIPKERQPVAVLLTSAANQGITAKYGEQPSPLRFSHPGSLESADEILSRGVPVLFARDAFYSAAQGCQLVRPPSSLKYFLRQVLDAWDMEQSRAQAKNAATPKVISFDKRVSEIADTKARIRAGMPT